MYDYSQSKLSKHLELQYNQDNQPDSDFLDLIAMQKNSFGYSDKKIWHYFSMLGI